MADWEKFARLCGLLASDFDGERATAAAFASKWLRENKLTWQDVADRASREIPEASAWTFRPRPQYRQPVDPDHWGKIDEMVKNHGEKFSDWERQFINSIRMRSDLTEKQEAVWDRLKKKYR